MRLLVLTEALSPQRRATVGRQHTWARRGRQRVRPGQALAAQWLHALLQAERALRRLLQRACTTAERWAVQASRHRRTPAQRLRASVNQHPEAIACAAAVNA
jgi:hypothetical protein